MQCLSGFVVYSPWVPLLFAQYFDLTKLVFIRG